MSSFGTKHIYECEMHWGWLVTQNDCSVSKVHMMVKVCQTRGNNSVLPLVWCVHPRSNLSVIMIMTCIQTGDLFYWQNAGMTKHLVENYLKEIVLNVFCLYKWLVCYLCADNTVTAFTISVWIYNHLMRNKSFLVFAVCEMSPSLLFSVEVLG